MTVLWIRSQVDLDQVYPEMMFLGYPVIYL
jgi:hypothetical protein